MRQFHAAGHRGRPIEQARFQLFYANISSDNRVSLIPKDLFCLSSLFFLALNDCLAMITQILHAIFTISIDINMRSSGFNSQGNDIGFLVRD